MDCVIKPPNGQLEHVISECCGAVVVMAMVMGLDNGVGMALCGGVVVM